MKKPIYYEALQHVFFFFFVSLVLRRNDSFVPSFFFETTGKRSPKIISLIGQSQCQIYIYIHSIRSHTRARTHRTRRTRTRNGDRRDRDPYRKRQGASVLRGRPPVIFLLAFADMGREV